MAQALFDGTCVSLANLLAAAPIVPGAVVSKPLINTPGCKVIVFAMDQGQAISDHQAPYLATVQILDGELEFTVADKTHTLTSHDWLVMPPNAKHNLIAHQPTRFVLTLVK